MAISRGLTQVDLLLKSAVLHSKISKVLFSANLSGHCFHFQEPMHGRFNRGGQGGHGPPNVSKNR